MKIDVKKYIEKQGWEYKETGDQYNLKNCPLCGDDRQKFYINIDSGLWDCKICEEKGNYYQLQAKMGNIEEIGSFEKTDIKKYKPLDSIIADNYASELWKDKVALEYLRGRGFKDETIKHFNLGVDGEWITIPHYKDKQLWNFKMRNYLKKDFRRVEGQPTVLFNIDNINKEKPTIVIVEGETDCIATWQMGINNVVGLTTGAGTFKPEWIPFFRKFKKVFICLNSDVPGQKGAYKIAEKIGFDLCRNVLLPTKDANDYLKEHTVDEFINEFGKAKQFNLKNVTDIAEYVEQIDDWFDQDGSLAGLRINFPELNTFLSGLKVEDLIILAGDAGIGKTTFALNLLYHLLKEDHRCLSFFLEGKIMYYIMRTMSIETKRKVEELRENEDEWEKTKETFSDFPMYYYSGAQTDLTFERMKDLLSAAVKLYDIEFVVIDNLQRLVKSARSNEVVNDTSNAVSLLKSLTIDLKIPILLISHIRKPERGVKRVSMHDAKSSSTIYQDCDVYLTLWNNKDPGKNTDDDIILSIEKNRMGEGGKDIPFVYEKNIATFRERIAEIDGASKTDYQKKRSTPSALAHDDIIIEEEE